LASTIDGTDRLQGSQPKNLGWHGNLDAAGIALPEKKKRRVWEAKGKWMLRPL
jgi:hypothetical protein